MQWLRVCIENVVKLFSWLFNSYGLSIALNAPHILNVNDLNGNSVRSMIRKYLLILSTHMYFV